MAPRSLLNIEIFTFRGTSCGEVSHLLHRALSLWLPFKQYPFLTINLFPKSLRPSERGRLCAYITIRLGFCILFEAIQAEAVVWGHQRGCMAERRLTWDAIFMLEPRTDINSFVDLLHVDADTAGLNWKGIPKYNDFCFRFLSWSATC